ncbi:MAG: rod shape-determining protein MreD [Actinomycetota bacterium]|nr:rod shape-determining protein MreD [Actinomycetota bacterium]
MSVAIGDARPHSALADLGIARVLAIGVLLIVALALQSTMLEQLTFLGVTPQLALIVVVSLAYLEGERVGIVTAFAAGLLLDLQLPEGAIVGISPLVYVFLAFAVASLRQYSVSESVWIPVLSITVVSAVAEFGYASLAIILGQRWVSLSYTAQVAGLVILYNTLLAPFVFPIVRRVSNRFGPRRVYRA